MSTIEEILASPMVAAAAELAKSEMQGNDPSHDFAHVMRVVKTSIYILENEPLFKCVPIDKLAVILGAYLHDVGDYKYSGRCALDPLTVLVVHKVFQR
eukprot:EC725741.1.p2 GENE.EC725741.1~~EC725741.1.p2  ORF type:complete len:98 (+),score=20.96 EC725741.1:45-338(+)